MSLDEAITSLSFILFISFSLELYISMCKFLTRGEEASFLSLREDRGEVRGKASHIITRATVTIR